MSGNNSVATKAEQKQGANWLDLVRRIWGECSDADADHLLWECTAFPFAGPIHVARQLRKLKAVAKGDVGKAIEFSYDQLTYDLG